MGAVGVEPTSSFLTRSKNPVHNRSAIRPGKIGAGRGIRTPNTLSSAALKVRGSTIATIPAKRVGISYLWIVSFLFAVTNP